MVNLYVQIGSHLIKGRIIQTVYFDQEVPQVIVTYLNNRKQICPLDDYLSTDQIDTILAQINDIHAQPCYPSESDDSGCPLGMANL